MKDSQPFRYVSGSIHSYRVPVELWVDRLKKMWASGLNAIEMYVFWNEHEPIPGVYDFEGQNDIIKFIKIAEDLGFLILLRPGKYIYVALMLLFMNLFFNETLFLNLIRPLCLC